MVTVAIPLLISGCSGSAGITSVRRAPRRRRSGGRRRQGRRNTTFVLVEAFDEATDRAVWFARRISAGGSARCTCRCERAIPVSGRAGSIVSEASPSSRCSTRTAGLRRSCAGAGVEAAARRVGLRHRRRAGAVPGAVPARGSADTAGAPPEAAAPCGAGRGRRRRPGHRRAARGDAGEAHRPV